jgi:hypothetical protein
MTTVGWLQISLLFLAVLLVIKPLGLYMARVFSGERTFLSPVLGRLERDLYRVSGINPEKEQSWLGYTLAMLAFSLAGFLTPLRDAAAAGLSAAQSARLSRRTRRSRLQHRSLLRHQHQLAELCR